MNSCNIFRYLVGHDVVNISASNFFLKSLFLERSYQNCLSVFCPRATGVNGLIAEIACHGLQRENAATQGPPSIA